MSTKRGSDTTTTAIHWYRNGLRLHDNPCLLKACQDTLSSSPSPSLLHLYVIDPNAPFAQTLGHAGAGCIRANFVLESIQEMNRKLQELESSAKMVVLLGAPEDVIPQVAASCHATALYYEKEPAAPIRAMDARVLKNLQEKAPQCKIHGFDTHTLHPMEQYLSKTKDMVAPSTYGGFTKIFQKLTVPQEVETVTAIPPTSADVITTLQETYGHQENQLDIPTLEQLGYQNVQPQLEHRAKGGIDFLGGEDAALALLEKQMKRARWVATFEKPDTSPNALTVDTTGLSPYVKHGCLSPRLFYHELSKVYARFPRESSKPPVSLHGQLMWREYNNLMGYTTDNFDKMLGNPVARQIPWDDDPELVSKWEHSQTGYPFIDAIMTQLRETGWIHHLARHAVACFLTRGDLWQSWEKGAAIFETYLIDADWSINNFNWQWLSCTAHFYQYFRCYSPVAFGKKTDPNGDYIRKWLPMFKTMPKEYIYEPWEAPLSVQRKCGVIVGDNYPHPIVDHKPTSKSNMSRMKEAYDEQKKRETEEAATRAAAGAASSSRARGETQGGTRSRSTQRATSNSKSNAAATSTARKRRKVDK